MKPQVLLVFQARFEECAAMLRGIAQYERSHASWASCLDDIGRAGVDADWVRRHSWDGVISHETTPTLARTCAELGLPLVDLSDRPLPASVARVRADHVALGQIGAEYFLDRGYRHFAFCGYRGVGWAEERRRGFIEGVSLAGHTCAVLELDEPGDWTPFWDAIDLDALTRWTRGLPRSVAVMACDDRCAAQVVRAAEAAGLLVPEQMSVLGANDDVMRCELANPPISSVSANRFQTGYVAAQLLDDWMMGRSTQPRDVCVEALGVVTRKSTDALAVTDRMVAKAIRFIAEHACRGISVDDVLREVLVSRSKLESRFRRHLGRSPQVEIRRVQVARITELLLQTDLPLSEIAEQTGFVHTEYMCVVFKRLTGEAPGRYRRKNQTEPLAV